MFGTIASLLGKVFNTTFIGHVIKIIWGNKSRVMKHLVVDYYLSWLKAFPLIPDIVVDGLSKYFDYIIDQASGSHKSHESVPEYYPSRPQLVLQPKPIPKIEVTSKEQNGIFDGIKAGYKKAYDYILPPKQQPGILDYFKKQEPSYFEKAKNYLHQKKQEMGFGQVKKRQLRRKQQPGIIQKLTNDEGIFGKAKNYLFGKQQKQGWFW